MKHISWLVARFLLFKLNLPLIIAIVTIRGQRGGLWELVTGSKCMHLTAKQDVSDSNPGSGQKCY